MLFAEIRKSLISPFNLICYTRIKWNIFYMIGGFHPECIQSFF